MAQPTVYYEGIRKEIIDFIPQEYTKVLEIGCGRGGFRENVSKTCEYWGVEPHKDVAAIAAKNIDKVLTGTFEEVFDDLPDNYFDLVICNDVIEHMVDHHKFYEQIKAKCVKNAYMIGSLPNVRYISNLIELLRKKDWEYKETGILDKTHLRFFTNRSIKRDFLAHQFDIEKLYGINEISLSETTVTVRLKIILFHHLFGEDTKFMQFGFRIKLTEVS